MTDDDVVDGLTAEDVLETLNLAERQRVATRCGRETGAFGTHTFFLATNGLNFRPPDIAHFFA
jgi:hypothetical protein